MSEENTHQRIADSVEAQLVALRNEGLPSTEILGVALVTIVGIIADVHGGDAAADAVEAAASRFRGLPRRRADGLREMVPAGRA